MPVIGNIRVMGRTITHVMNRKARAGRVACFPSKMRMFDALKCCMTTQYQFSVGFRGCKAIEHSFDERSLD